MSNSSKLYSLVNLNTTRLNGQVTQIQHPHHHHSVVETVFVASMLLSLVAGKVALKRREKLARKVPKVVCFTVLASLSGRSQEMGELTTGSDS